MLNPTGANRKFFLSRTHSIYHFTNIYTVSGKCGYVWGATGLICLVVAYFGLPEMKGRSYREIDIMFKRKIPARQWKKTEIDVNADE